MKNFILIINFFLFLLLGIDSFGISRTPPNGIAVPSGTVLIGGASNAGATTSTGLVNQVLTAQGGTSAPIWKSIQAGVKNYIVTGDAESGTTGFATYNGGTTSPTSGTGGTPSATWTTTSSSVLEDSNSFLLTKGATNRQGDGVSYNFTINRKDQAKVMQISFNYLVSSGTFNAGTVSTASDVTVWIYDVTNSALIQPSSINLLSNSTTISDKFSATFQTASNSTSYRLILHIGSTNASAYTLMFDSIAVSPSSYIYGTPVTDWQTYTPTMTGLGTVTITDSFFKRVGDSIYIKGRFSLGTPTGATAAIGLPAGYVIDSGKMTIQSTIEGNLTNNSAATVFLPLGVGADTSVGFSNAASSGLSKLVGTSIGSSGNNIGYAIGPIPILGFSSSVQMSDQNDSREVSWVGYVATNQAVTANVTDIPLTSRKDTHGGWSGSSYTVKTPGNYIVTSVSSPTTAVTYYNQAYVNGTVVRSIASSSGGANASGATVLTDLNVGDVISFRSGVSLTVSSDTVSSFTITKISGSSTVGVNEVVTLSYVNTAGTSIGTTATIVPFATKEWDSHGLWNSTNANAFTARTADRYQVSVVLTNVGVNLATNQGFFVDIYKNGTFYKHVGSGLGTGVLNNHCVSGTVDIQLNAGEYFDVRAISSVATTLLTSNGYNSISVKRIGR